MSDIALMFADGSSKGNADPAFDARMMPIGELSMACWEGLVTYGPMEAIVKAAKLMIDKIKNLWARVCGPGLPWL